MIGMPELLVILVIVVLVFGAGKLPQVGDAMGKAIRNFKRATSGRDELEVNREKAEIEVKKKAEIEAATDVEVVEEPKK